MSTKSEIVKQFSMNYCYFLPRGGPFRHEIQKKGGTAFCMESMFPLFVWTSTHENFLFKILLLHTDVSLTGEVFFNFWMALLHTFFCYLRNRCLNHPLALSHTPPCVTQSAAIQGWDLAGKQCWLETLWTLSRVGHPPPSGLILPVFADLSPRDKVNISKQ